MSLLLFVSVGESTYPLEVEPMATVGDLQQALGEALGRKAGQLRFQGRMLRPDALLADEGLCQESRLEEEAFVRPVFDMVRHGENAEFRDGGREASRFKYFMGAVVFTATPVVEADCDRGGFMVEVTEQETKWAGSLKIGFVAGSPPEMPDVSCRGASWGWQKLPKACGVDTSVLAGNVVLCQRVGKKMHVTTLQSIGGTVLHSYSSTLPHHNRALHGFCDLYGQTKSVKILWQNGGEVCPPDVPLTEHDSSSSSSACEHASSSRSSSASSAEAPPPPKKKCVVM
eukprot:TRINITY_DN12712_c0_g1_i1.p1 TRINITY_DN12712_c0_g1~~TRINITY_DN12712_c0_g1_i1.p1  ORF type:complete len:285 (+),score=50.06 TRINITY_DN12712_c0_g1_i1:116-970(+)